MFQCDTSERTEAFPIEKPSDMEAGLGNIDLWSDSFETYISVVQEYSRQLSYEHDVEKTFAGLASVIQERTDGYPVIHGMLADYFGYSMMWMFHEGIDSLRPFADRERRKRRRGFPSWSWMGWIGSTIIMGDDVAPPDRIEPAVDDLEIMVYWPEKTPRSIYHMVGLMNPNPKLPSADMIQINFEPLKYNCFQPSTLSCMAEMTRWDNFILAPAYCNSPLFPFSLRGTSLSCGFLSVTPDPAHYHEIFDQASEHFSGFETHWALAQWCQFNMPPPRFEDKFQNVAVGLDERLFPH